MSLPTSHSLGMRNKPSVQEPPSDCAHVRPMRPFTCWALITLCRICLPIVSHIMDMFWSVKFPMTPHVRPLAGWLVVWLDSLLGGWWLGWYRVFIRYCVFLKMLWIFLTLPVLQHCWCLTCHCVHTLTPPRGSQERPESGIYEKIRQWPVTDIGGWPLVNEPSYSFIF